MGLKEVVSKLGGTVGKELGGGKWPIVRPSEKGQAFVGKFVGIWQRSGQRGAFNTYQFDDVVGDTLVEVSKGESRNIEAGETVTIAGKAFDDVAGSLVFHSYYGAEYLGQAASKSRGQNPMELWRIVLVSR